MCFKMLFKLLSISLNSAISTNMYLIKYIYTYDLLCYFTTIRYI